jgi:hypothetical protein
MYTKEDIQLLANLFGGDKAAYAKLVEMNKKELVLLPHAIIDDMDMAFKAFVKTDNRVLAAFAKACQGEKKSIKFLIDNKAPEWAATAGYVNGDENAKLWLQRNKLNVYVALAEAIQKALKDEAGSDFQVLFNPFR